MGITERKQREKEQRRQDIILTAEEIIFSRGIETATVDAVAEAAELSKGTVYLYFKNKEELIAAVFHRGMDLLQKMMVDAAVANRSAIEKLRGLGKVYLDFAREYPDHFALMLAKELHKMDADETKPEAVSCIRAGLDVLNILKMTLIEGIQEGSVRADVDPAQLALIIWGQIHGVIAIASQKASCEHFREFCIIDLETIVPATIDVIIKGIQRR